MIMRNFQDKFEEEEREELLKLHRKGCIAVLFAILVAIECAATSCKSMNMDVNHDVRDSIILHHVYDTVRVTIIDSVRAEKKGESEKESTTELTFGEGGGTYNSHTGEATNVLSVKQSSKEKELQHQLLNYVHIVDSQAVKIDSLQQAITELHHDEHMEQNTKDITPRSGWDRFCTWWTIGSWILILLAVAWWLFKKFYLHR